MYPSGKLIFGITPDIFIKWRVLNICDAPRIYFYSGRLFWICCLFYYKNVHLISLVLLSYAPQFFSSSFLFSLYNFFTSFYLLLCRLAWKRISLEIIQFRCQWQNHVVLLLLFLLIHWLVGKILESQCQQMDQNFLNFQLQILWR